MSSVIEISDASFQTEVAGHKGFVLVDFWAPWCGPCKAIAPVLDAVSKEMSGQVKFTKIDIDNNPEMASNLNIRSIPTLMLFKDGQLVDSKLGGLSQPVLKQWLENAVAA